MKILPQLLCELTRHPRREVRLGVDFEWSHSWIFNAFRLYESIFGRRCGKNPNDTIRYEGTTEGYMVDGEVVVVHHFGTLENFLVFVEERLRSFFKTWKLGFRLVPVPQYALAGVSSRSPFRLAIAFDNAGSNNANPGTTVSVTFTITGSNIFLFLFAMCNIGDLLSSLTATKGAADTAATAIDKQASNGGGGEQYSYYMVSPDTGSNTMKFNVTVGHFLIFGGSSYSGCAQTGQPDAHGAFTVTTASYTETLTSVMDNSWHVTGLYCGDVATVSGTTVSRTTQQSSLWNLADSNGPKTPAGSSTTTFSIASSQIIQTNGVMVAPVAGAATTVTYVPQLLTLSVG